MEVTIYERLILSQFLPSVGTGGLVKVRVLKELLDELGFSEEEIVEHNIRQVGERIKWDEKGTAKEIEVGPVREELVLDVLRHLDAQERLDLQLLELCEKMGYEGAGDDD